MKYNVKITGFVAIILLFLFYIQSNAAMMGNAMMRGRGMYYSRSQIEQKNNFANKDGFSRVRIFCSQCHAIPAPNQLSSKQWSNTIQQMLGFMKEYGKKVPNNEQLQSIIKFYTTNSK